MSQGQRSVNDEMRARPAMPSGFPCQRMWQASVCLNVAGHEASAVGGRVDGRGFSGVRRTQRHGRFQSGRLGANRASVGYSSTPDESRKLVFQSRANGRRNQEPHFARPGVASGSCATRQWAELLEERRKCSERTGSCHRPDHPLAGGKLCREGKRDGHSASDERVHGLRSLGFLYAKMMTLGALP